MVRSLPVFLFLTLLTTAACRENGTVTVHSITFKGVSAVDSAQLKNALATREDSTIPLLGVRLPWSKQHNYFDRSRFEEDLKRIQAFYSDRGYPDARVAGFDVKLNSKQDEVDVSLTITEGAPVMVTTVELRGFDVIPAAHLGDLRKRMPLHVGQPRDRESVVLAHELALNELRDHGYPYSRVTTDEEDGPTGKEANVIFTAEPGTLAHFGTVQIVGNKSVGENVIRRKLTFKPGEIYRRSAVQETQRRLYAMELFQFVNIESMDAEQQSPEVTTRVTVAEGRHQRINGGIGYGTEEKARVDGEYHHVNFLGGARSAGVHARWSSLDRGVRLDFQQPAFFFSGSTLGMDGQKWYTYTPAYNSVVTGARLALANRINEKMSWTVSVASERTNSAITQEVLDDPKLYNDLIALGLDPTTNTQSGTLSTVGLDFQRSTADNVLNARHGYQVALHVEKAGEWLPGTFNYYSTSGDARHYLPISKRLVIANRVQFGNIRAANDDPTQVPFSRKYFLGGASNLRGWGRYEVSPLGGSGLPIGGNVLLGFNSEARVGLRGALSGVLFLDGGNVWADRHSVDLNELRYAIGAGLRYRTPVGPIRFDYGYQLNPIDGLLVNGEPQARQWRIHFSIGQAF